MTVYLYDRGSECCIFRSPCLLLVMNVQCCSDQRLFSFHWFSNSRKWYVLCRTFWYCCPLSICLNQLELWLQWSDFAVPFSKFWLCDALMLSTSAYFGVLLALVLSISAYFGIYQFLSLNGAAISACFGLFYSDRSDIIVLSLVFQTTSIIWYTDSVVEWCCHISMFWFVYKTISD